MTDLDQFTEMLMKANVLFSQIERKSHIEGYDRIVVVSVAGAYAVCEGYFTTDGDILDLDAYT